MGFAAGFGEAFSRSWEQGEQASNQKKRDLFQAAYNSYMDNKKQFDADRKADTQARQTAKDLVATTPDIPAGAWTYAYKWLRAGLSPEDTIKKLQTTRFEPIGGVAAPDKPDQAQGLDAQMQQSGMLPQQEPVPGAATNDTMPDQMPGQEGGDEELLSKSGGQIADANGVGGPLAASGGIPSQDNGGIFGAGPQLGQQKDFNRANQDVMSATGATQAEMDMYNQGFQPTDVTDTMSISSGGGPMGNPLAEFGLDKSLTKAKYEAVDAAMKLQAASGNDSQKAQAARWEAIKPDLMARIEGGADTKAISDALKPTYDARMKGAEAKVAAVSMAREAKTVDDIVQKYPQVLTVGGQGTALVSSLVTDVNSVFTELGDWMSNNPNATIQDVEKQAQGLISNIGNGQTDETASAYREFTAASVRLAFSAAKSMSGGGGQSLSDKDFKNTQTSLFASNNPKDFSNNLRNFVGNVIQSVDTQNQAMFNSPDILNLMSSKQIPQGIKDALEQSIGTVSETYKDDPALQWATQRWQDQYSGKNKTGTPKAPIAEQSITQSVNNTPTQQNVQPTEGVITQQMIDAANGQIPPEAKGKKYRLNNGNLEIY